MEEMMARAILAGAESFHSAFGRPPWQRSETDVGAYLTRTHGSGWEDQVDFLQGSRMKPPVMVGPDKIGSTRPEFYHAGHAVAVEVKNWPLDRVSMYAAHLRLQMAQRRWSVPAGTSHWIFFDLRGQRVGSLRDLARFLDKMMTEYQIECEEVYFMLDTKCVRAL
jgi:hypothetical protein